MDIITNAYQVAERFLDLEEVPGQVSNPQILAMLKLDMKWPEDDSVPWCSAFMNYVAFLLALERSRSLLARSWIKIGQRIRTNDTQSYYSPPEIGMDIVVLKRGGGDQPGSDNVTAPGHVGLYGGESDERIFLLGGNQSDKVSVSKYDQDRVLVINRLRPDYS